MSKVYDESLKLHEEHAGKIEVVSKVSVKNKEDLLFSSLQLQQLQQLQQLIISSQVYYTILVFIHCSGLGTT